MTGDQSRLVCYRYSKLVIILYCSKLVHFLVPTIRHMSITSTTSCWIIQCYLDSSIDSNHHMKARHLDDNGLTKVYNIKNFSWFVISYCTAQVSTVAHSQVMYASWNQYKTPYWSDTNIYLDDNACKQIHVIHLLRKVNANIKWTWTSSLQFHHCLFVNTMLYTCYSSNFDSTFLYFALQVCTKLLWLWKIGEDNYKCDIETFAYI